MAQGQDVALAEPPTLKMQLAKMQPEFAKALPGHITPEKFVRTAQTALAMTRNIEKVRNPQSLLAACTKAAADGLILDGREAALVVDYNGDAQYRPMTRGLLKLAWQSGELKGIVVEAVRKGDKFRHVPTNLTSPIQHEINHEVERGDVTAFYAMAELREGGLVHEVMSVSEVNRIRDRSDAYKAFKSNKIKSTPWNSDYVEMGRKTVFRRLSKYLPSSTDRSRFQQAVERIDEDYSFEIEGEAVPTQPAATGRHAPKQRGGAAAALKDVTPPKPAPKAKPKTKVQPRQEPQQIDDDPRDDVPPVGEAFDPATGEIVDGDDI